MLDIAQIFIELGIYPNSTSPSYPPVCIKPRAALLKGAQEEAIRQSSQHRATLHYVHYLVVLCYIIITLYHPFLPVLHLATEYCLCKYRITSNTNTLRPISTLRRQGSHNYVLICLKGVTCTKPNPAMPPSVRTKFRLGRVI